MCLIYWEIGSILIVEVFAKMLNKTEQSGVKNKQGNGTGILGISRDITEREQAEKKLLNYQERLRNLVSEMSLAAERERKRITLELREQVTQNLILFKINVGLLRKNKLPVELVKPLDEIYERLDQIIQDMRSLTSDLGCPTLYELGLEAAVREWLNEEVQQKHRLKTEFEDDGQHKSLDDDVSTLMYRAIRELLTNVVKHAQAQHVKVSICKDDSNIRINVIDDGVGFRPPTEGFGSDETKGFGLFSICERLRYFGGNVEIKSEPGHGTRVTLVAPIKYGKLIQ